MLSYVRNLPMRSWNRPTFVIHTGRHYVRNLPMRSWNPIPPFILEIKLMVRNLPMRSWNFFVFLQAFCACKFAIYQWGVETDDSHICYSPINPSFAIYQWGVETKKEERGIKVMKMFAIYQWGVETSKSNLCGNQLRTVRNLPMRSWNERTC